MKKYFLLLSLWLLGCSSIPALGPTFQENGALNESEATVHFFRPKTFYMQLVEINLFVNENLSGVISNGTYSSLQLPSGAHKFKAKEKRRGTGYSAAFGPNEWEFEYELKAGEVYYVVWYPSSIFGKKYKGQFIISNIYKPYNPVTDGALTRVKAEFGVVKNQFAEEQIMNTKKSNSIVDETKI